MVLFGLKIYLNDNKIDKALFLIKNEVSRSSMSGLSAFQVSTGWGPSDMPVKFSLWKSGISFSPSFSVCCDWKQHLQKATTYDRHKTQSISFPLFRTCVRLLPEIISIHLLSFRSGSEATETGRLLFTDFFQPSSFFNSAHIASLSESGVSRATKHF